MLEKCSQWKALSGVVSHRLRLSFSYTCSFTSDVIFLGSGGIGTYALGLWCESHLVICIRIAWQKGLEEYPPGCSPWLPWWAEEGWRWGKGGPMVFYLYTLLRLANSNKDALLLQFKQIVQ